MNRPVKPKGVKLSKRSLSTHKKAKPQNIYQSEYQKQLQKRLEICGGESFTSREILEVFLLRSGARRNVRPAVEALFKHFDSLNSILSAPAQRLKDVKGVTNSMIDDLKIANALVKSLSKEKIRKKPLLGSLSSVLEHCRTVMAYEEREQMRVLFLTKKNMLITEEVLQTGTVDRLSVHPREIVKRALELSASALILIHNHPSGDPDPTLSDIHMTHRLAEALEPLNIVLHDHLIISKEGHTSLRGLQLLK